MAAMTNMSQMTLNDGATTPVGHIFSPASNGNDGVARWQDREHNGGIALGFSTFTFSVREPLKVGGPSKVRCVLTVPKLDTTTVVPTLIGWNGVTVEFSFAGVSTRQDRLDVRSMLLNAISAGGLGDNIVDLQRPY